MATMGTSQGPAAVYKPVSLSRTLRGEEDLKVSVPRLKEHAEESRTKTGRACTCVSERLPAVGDSNPEPLLTWMYSLSSSNTYKRVHLAPIYVGLSLNIIKYHMTSTQQIS